MKYRIPANTEVETANLTNDRITWRPYVTKKETTFSRFESMGEHKMTFNHKGLFLIRATFDDVVWEET